MTAIAILGGSGQQGGGLARRLAAGGRPVLVGSRDPARARKTVATWGVAREHVDVADNATAAGRCDITVLAVPFQAVDALLDEVNSRFRPDSVVIDVTVPLAFSGGTVSVLPLPEGSATEHIRARLPDHVHLAAAFKTLPAHLINNIGVPLDCDEFVCADSDRSRTEAAALVAALPGLRPVDVGSLTRARFVEHMTALAVAINRRHNVREARFAVIGLR